MDSFQADSTTHETDTLTDDLGVNGETWSKVEDEDGPEVTDVGGGEEPEPEKKEEPTEPETPEQKADDPDNGGQKEEPKAEEPQKEEPKAEEPTSTPASADVETFNQKISELSEGRFKTIEDLVNSDVFQIYGQAGDLVDELEKLRGLADREPEFANDWVKGLNDFVKQGGDPNLYARIQGVNVDELPPMERMALQMKWENPDISDENIRIILENKYQQNAEDGSNERKLGDANLELDSRKATNWLKEHQVKSATPDPVKAEERTRQLEETRVENWSKTLNELPNYINKFDVPVNDKGETFEFEFKDQHKASLMEKVSEMVRYSPHLKHDEAGIKDVWAATQHLIKSMFFEEMMAEAVKSELNKLQESTFKEQHNPSAGKPEEAPATVDSNEPKDEQDFLLKMLREDS